MWAEMKKVLDHGGISKLGFLNVYRCKKRDVEAKKKWYINSIYYNKDKVDRQLRLADT